MQATLAGPIVEANPFLSEPRHFICRAVKIRGFDVRVLD
jgi:hypothetical protein